MGILGRDVPRIPPNAIVRARLHRRIGGDLAVPVRLLVAPPGSGKTTLALQSLADSRLGAYCAVPFAATSRELIGALCEALGLMPAATYAAMLIALRVVAKEPLKLVVDDADKASPPARALLTQLVQDCPGNVALIYCMRDRTALDVKSWVARGFASLTEAARLAFDASDVSALCEAWRVTYTHADVARLIEETDGWAVVVGGAIRACAEDERSLGDAYERWRARFGEMFLEFVLGQAEEAEPEDYARVQALVHGREVDPSDGLRRLESQGLFVFNDGGTVRALKPLHLARNVNIHVDTSIPMVVRMLGKFSASIHGQQIQWVRRRDQQIVKYLLLQRGASATRPALAKVFWPNADKQLAAQSLRTACSNIRKAIAAIVGYARVEYYFRVGTSVTLDLSNVVTDLGRIGAHVGAGNAAYDAGDMDEAATHYRAAEKMYGGRLYEEDAIEPWFAHASNEIEEQLATVLQRLAEAAYAQADLKHAAEYAYRAKLIRPDIPGVVALLSKLQDRKHPA